eukprot:GCRY01000481.1.p1 GENE.GCRY01000481.1~~GCRY01000481.1.p1  ORF type:complete len:542 (+),score=96.65 GCRY01000481.1:217-1842(+)
MHPGELHEIDMENDNAPQGETPLHVEATDVEKKEYKIQEPKEEKVYVEDTAEGAFVFSGEKPPVVHSFEEPLSAFGAYKKALATLTTPTIAGCISSLGVVCMIYAALYIGAFWDPKDKIGDLDVGFYNADKGFDWEKLLSALPSSQQAAYAGLKNSPNGSYFVEQIVRSDSMSSVFSWKFYAPQEVTDAEGVVLSEAKTREELIDDVKDRSLKGVIVIPETFSAAMYNLSSESISVSELLNISISAPHVLEVIHSPALDYLGDSFFMGAVEKIRAAIEVNLKKLLAANIHGTTLESFLSLPFMTAGLQIKDTQLTIIDVYGINMVSYLIFVLLYLAQTLNVNFIKRYLEVPLGELRDAGYSPFAVAMLIYFMRFVYTVMQTAVAVLSVCIMWDDFSKFGVFFIFCVFVNMIFAALLASLCLRLGVDMYTVSGAIFMILNLVTCGGIMAVEMQSGFFVIGQGFPFFHAVRISRNIFFDAYSEDMTLSFIVLLCWFIPLQLILIVAETISVKRRWTNFTGDRPSYRGPQWSLRNWHDIKNLYI